MAKKKTLTDVNGNCIPVNIIDKTVVKRDETVQKIVDEAVKLQAQMQKSKEKINKLLFDYLEELARSYGENWKGNTDLFSFDAQKKVSVNVNETIEFGPELQLAKKKIDSCLSKWTEGGNDNIRAIINDAFNVDSKGKLPKYRILSLARYNIKDDDWKEAIEIINKAITVTKSKQYINIYMTDETGSFKPVSLNFSSL